jgi:hypothetical protein
MIRRKRFVSTMIGLVATLATGLNPLLIAPAQAKPGKIELQVPAEVNLAAADLSCLSEDVHIAGVMPMTIIQVGDRGGGFHMKISLLPELTGNGLSTGDIYTYSGAGSLTVYYPRGFGVEPRTLASVSSGHVVGPDGRVLVLVIVTQHLTVNANGVVTVDSSDMETRCA